MKNKIITIIKKGMIVLGIATGIYIIGNAIYNNAENNSNKYKEQARIEQTHIPTILNYEGTDSVQIQRTTNDEYINHATKRTGIQRNIIDSELGQSSRIMNIERLYIKSPVHLSNSQFNNKFEYVLTEMHSQEGIVYEVGLEKHFLINDSINSDSLIDAVDVNRTVISPAYDSKFQTKLDEGNFQAKRDYYAHKFDSLENVLKLKK